MVSPRSTIYSTPRVLAASSITPPSVLAYSVAPRLAGTAKMSSSPLMNWGVRSGAEAAMVNV